MAIRLRASIAEGSPALVVARSLAAGRQPARTAAFFGRPAAYATNAGGGADKSEGAEPTEGRHNKKEPLPERDAYGDKDKVEMKRGGDNIQFTWSTAFFTVAMCGGCLLYYQHLLNNKAKESRAVTRHEKIGVPKLGGPFELRDRKGKVVTDVDLKGQYLLIYFGFSKCPDICPLEMVKQTRAIEIVEEEFGPIAVPVFISVDPPRDTPEVVDEYCKEFHPRIVGLTGTVEQVKKSEPFISCVLS